MPAVIDRETAARLDRHRRQAMAAIGIPNHEIRGAEHRIEALALEGGAVDHVVLSVGMELLGAGCFGGVDIDQRREFFEFDLNQFQRVFREIPVGGNDNGDGFADEANAVERKYGPQHELEARLLGIGAQRLDAAGEVRPGKDRDYAVSLARGRAFDFQDAGVRMRAQQERQMERTGGLRYVVDERAMAAQQRRILATRDAPADQPSRGDSLHVRYSRVAGAPARSLAAAFCTARTMWT